MSRPLILSNGSVAVGINNYGLVHDFYYPYVGLENHATSKVLRHRIGVWIEGEFSWLDDGDWEITHDYEEGVLIGRVVARHPQLRVRVEFRDCVDSQVNAFLRQIAVINEADYAREIRLFMHQVYQISNSRNGDTAQYLPEHNAILSYKGRRMFIIRAEQEGGTPFDQYSVGIWGIEGREGTYKDAEDGELSGNAVEHGSVDSVLRLRFELAPESIGQACYWVAAGTSFAEALDISDGIKQSGFPRRFDATAKYWHQWLEPAARVAERFGDPVAASRFLKSTLLIKAHTDRRGAVIASLDTQMLRYARDAYVYCWPRDAAFALWPLVRMGYKDEAKSFFDFCKAVLHKDGYLMHKYQADRALGSSWHPYVHNGKPELPIQEDETALVLFLIGQYQQLIGDDDYIRSLYEPLIKPMATFLTTYVDASTKLPHASYDLWEQKFLTTTFTVATVYSALSMAAHLAEQYGHHDDAISWQTVADDMREAARTTLFNDKTGFFQKGFLKTDDGLHFDETVDMSSFYGAFMFGLFEVTDPRFTTAYETLVKTFIPEDFKGMPRFVHDTYNAEEYSGLGNPWFITSLWLAEYYLEMNDVEQAQEVIKWVESHMLPSGVLSEQINPHNGHFVSVAPLTWSQAEYLSAQLDALTHPAKQPPAAGTAHE